MKTIHKVMKSRLINSLVVVTAIFISSCSNGIHESDAYGNFEAEDIIISSEGQGKIMELKIEEGDKLEKGQYLGYIDTISLHIQKEQLNAQKKSIALKISNIKAQIDVQEEQLKTIQREKKRIQKLMEDEAATPQQYDDIQGKYDVLVKQIKATKTQISSVYGEMDVIDKKLNLMDNQIQKSKIINPVNGVVLEKFLKINEMAGMGSPLYKIAPLHYITLRVYISGSQLDDIDIGQKVTVLIDKSENDFWTYEGEIFWISDEAEFTPKIIQTKEERVNMVYAAKVRVKNDGKLKIGMPGEIRF